MSVPTLDLVLAFPPVDDDAPTGAWERPMFLGLPVPPHPANEQLPDQRAAGSTVETLCGRAAPRKAG